MFSRCSWWHQFRGVMVPKMDAGCARSSCSTLEMGWMLHVFPPVQSIFKAAGTCFQRWENREELRTSCTLIHSFTAQPHTHTDILSSSSSSSNTEWTVQILKKKKRSSRPSLEREVIIGIYHKSGEGKRKGSDSVRSEMKEKVKCSKIKTHPLKSCVLREDSNYQSETSLWME